MSGEQKNRLDDAALASYAAMYRDLHRHPELGLQEYRTADVVALKLRELGLKPQTNIGGTGVVAVFRNGVGPIIGLRADMDALPVREETGLEYASTVTAQHPELGEVGVAHACGHDLHVTCLLGALDVLLRERDDWSGTLVCIFQPGEETGHGARRMVEDGLFDELPKPEVLLAQHVGPAPVGFGAVHSDLVMGASDSLDITFFGQGGHASQPEACIDPVLMAANFIVRVQSLVSRRIASGTPAVVTVGAVHAGSMAASIPDTADLKINVRTSDDETLSSVLRWLEELAVSEAEFWSAPKPEITHVYHLPALRNTPGSAEVVRRALTEELGEGTVFELPPVSASEDFGLLVEAAECESVYWFFGGMTETSLTLEDGSFPTNHSSKFAPDAEAGVRVGIDCLVSAFKAINAERNERV